MGRILDINQAKNLIAVIVLKHRHQEHVRLSRQDTDLLINHISYYEAVEIAKAIIQHKRDLILNKNGKRYNTINTPKDPQFIYTLILKIRTSKSSEITLSQTTFSKLESYLSYSSQISDETHTSDYEQKVPLQDAINSITRQLQRVWLSECDTVLFQRSNLRAVIRIDSSFKAYFYINRVKKDDAIEFFNMIGKYVISSDLIPFEHIIFEHSPSEKYEIVFINNSRGKCYIGNSFNFETRSFEKICIKLIFSDRAEIKVQNFISLEQYIERPNIRLAK